MSRFVDHVGVPNTPSNFTATTSSTQMLAANPQRRGLVVINLGTANVSFGCNGATAVLNSGITLLPNGTWVMDQFTFCNTVINVIAGGSCALSIQEYV